MATGKQIKHYREKLGWTLLQLSDVSEVDVGTISALEVRDSSRSKYFSSIAKAFGLTLEQLENEGEDYPLSPPSQSPLANAFPEGKDAAIVTKLPLNEPIPQHVDMWTQAAIEIMRGLDIGQQQAMVAKMREYQQFLGPPRNGQTLPVAVKKEISA